MKKLNSLIRHHIVQANFHSPLITLIVMMTATASYAQNFREDFALLTARIESAETCHIVSKVTVYESKKNLQKIVSFGAELTKNESAYRSKMDDVEIISNEDFILMVDYEEKLVQVERTPKLSKTGREFLKDFYAVDSVSKTSDSIQFVSRDADLVTYKMNLGKGMFETITVVLNTAEKSLSRIEYEYNKTHFPSGNYVVIEYTTFDLSAAIDKSVFDAADIVTKKGTDFNLNERYRGFELVNLYQTP